jgi:hypothetical protein
MHVPGVSFAVGVSARRRNQAHHVSKSYRSSAVVSMIEAAASARQLMRDHRLGVREVREMADANQSFSQESAEIAETNVFPLFLCELCVLR